MLDTRDPEDMTGYTDPDEKNRIYIYLDYTIGDFNSEDDWVSIIEDIVW